MPRYREQEVVPADARAVVRNPEAPNATAFDVHVDLRGRSVERVLEQLLERGRRTLDDLAGSDLIDEMVGERPDACHGRRRESGRARTGVVGKGARQGIASSDAGA
jgi:hypothetical protein